MVTVSSSPTTTERRLQQSLVSSIRHAPAEEVTAGQSLVGGQSRPRRGGGSSGNGPAPDPQPVSEAPTPEVKPAPTPTPTPTDTTRRTRPTRDPVTGLVKGSSESQAAFTTRSKALIRAREQTRRQSLARPSQTSAANISLPEGGQGIAGRPILLQDSTPQGKFGGREVTRAPTTKEQLAEIRRTQNPVTGTLTFVLEKGRGKLAKLSETKAPRGQNIFGGQTGTRIRQTTEAGIFLIPVVGSTLAVSAGAAQLTTKGGRKEISTISESVSTKTSIPKPVVTSAVVASSIGLTVSGVKGLTGSAERLTGRTAINVRVLGTQTIKSGEQIITKSVGTGVRKGLLTDKQFIFASASKIKTKGESAKTVLAETTGVISEVKGASLRTGKKRFSKPRKFQSVELGFTSPADLGISRKALKGLGLTEKRKGFVFVGGSRTRVKTALGTKDIKSFSIAKSVDVGDFTIIAGRSARTQKKFIRPDRLTKQDRTSSLGVIKKQKDFTRDVEIMGIPKSTLSTKVSTISAPVSEAVTVRAVESAVKTSSLPSGTLHKITSVTRPTARGAQRIQTTTVPATKITSLPTPQVKLRTVSEVRSRSLTLSGVGSRTRTRAASKSRAATRVRQKNVQSLRSSQLVRTTQKPAARTRLRQKAIQKTTLRGLGRGPGLPRTPVLPRISLLPIGGKSLKKKPLKSAKKKKREGGGTLFFTPDLTSRALGLTTKIPVSTLARRTSGLGLRKIPIFTNRRKKRR